MAGLFSEINEGDELVREKTLKLLAHKLKNMGPDVLTREVQQVMVSECKKVLTVSQFGFFSSFLLCTLIRVLLVFHISFSI